MSSTASTEDVGRAEARELATGPSSRRTAGSVGRAVMPANEALYGVLASSEGGYWRSLDHELTAEVVARHRLAAS